MSPKVRGLPVVASLAILLVSCSSAGTPASAWTDPPQSIPQARSAPAHEALTIDALYDADKKVDFSGHPATNLVWIDDAHYLWPKSDRKTKEAQWELVEADTGKSQPFEPAARLEKALAAVPEIGAERAKKNAHSDASLWAGAPRAMLFDVAKDLYVYSVGPDTVRRATSTPDLEEEEALLSPDGTRVAFVRDHDLYVADVETGTERRLTSDGSAKVLNGKLDWVYQEEVYGRGTWRSFWWSPDSRRLAFLRIDEADVPVYTLVDDVESPADVLTSPYPRAGDPNPTVKLGIAGAEGGVEWVDLGRYSGGEFLIVDVGWSPAGDLFFQVQDRVQTWLDLNLVPAGAATPQVPKTLLRETTEAFVSLNGSPKWLADGTFLWPSERTGWQHFYRYDKAGTLLAQVTSGEWEARDLRGIDEKEGWIYFSGTERSAVTSDEYRVKMDGKGLERLTKVAGAHGAKWNPSFTRFLDSWSDLGTPVQVRLHRSDGTEVRVVDENPVPELARYGFVRPELLTVKTRDGFEMEAMLIKPPDFDPARRYPVFQNLYGGPHAPVVRNGWLGTNGMFFQLLAQKGVVVWMCDNRSASGKGAKSAWSCYRRMGPSELADIEDGIAWLKQQPWVDPDRIGISGWSYGGFMASYALTHSKSFAMGIAGGSVTDFRNYDTIYTERYMLRPKDNPDGYAATSVAAKAADLHGELLLIHGALDDNVHPQSSMQLAYALQKAGKPFRMMLYPKSSHGVSDPKLVKHLRAMMLEFVEETLLGAAPRP
jgi:dipeptidyl-peptidase-4